MVRRLTASIMTLVGLMLLVPVSNVATIRAQETEDYGRVAIDAIAATKPTTASELIHAVRVVGGLGDSQAARQYLQQLIQLNLNQQQLAALAKEYGSEVFVKILGDTDLAPEGAQVATMVLGASKKKEFTDPAKMRQWVTDLGSDEPKVKFAAMDSLRNSRGAAVAPLIEALADDSKSADHVVVLAMIEKLGIDATAPLVSMLETEDMDRKAAVISAMQLVAGRREAVSLLGPYFATVGADDPAEDKVHNLAGKVLMQKFGVVPDESTAAAVLIREVERYLNQVTPLGTRDLDGQLLWWTWDDNSGELAEAYLPKATVYRNLAARYAGDAMAVLSDHPAVQKVYIASQLEKAAYEKGLDIPLDDSDAVVGEVKGFTPEAIELALIYAMDDEHPAAAAAAARILGQVGDEKQILTGADTITPLVRAANNSDRRVRFAAVEAIMNIGPTKPYPGSSDVYQSLVNMARSSGIRRAIVAAPILADASHLAGFLIPLGYEPISLNRNRDVAAEAMRAGDVELILIDSRTVNPEIEMFIQQIRQDYRMSDIPIGITARADEFERAERAAEHDDQTIMLPRPHNAKSIAWCVEQLEAVATDGQVDAQVRAAQAKAAVAWLDTLLGEEGLEVYSSQPVERNLRFRR